MKKYRLNEDIFLNFIITVLLVILLVLFLWYTAEKSKELEIMKIIGPGIHTEDVL